MSSLISQARGRVPRIAEAAVERARLTVVPRRVRTAPRVPFVSLVSLLMITGVVGLLLFNTSMQQASFTATELEGRAAVLDAKEQSLRMELDMLRDPQKVAARAKELGMVPASSLAFIRLEDGKVLGSPAVSTPSESMRITPLPTSKPKNLRPKKVIERIERRHRDTGPASASPGVDTGTHRSGTDSGVRGASER